MPPAFQVVLAAELLVALVAAGVFMALHGRGSWWRLPDGRPDRAGRQLMWAAGVVAAETLVLLLVLLGLRPPWPALVGVYAAMDLVMIRWVILRWITRSRRSRS
jgi:hypothetical protein